MDTSDLQFLAFLAVAVPGLFLPTAIARWKGRAVVPVALLSLTFWPAALVVALRMRSRRAERALAAAGKRRGKATKG